jgi:two-component system sensor histidine kinase UhpB
MKFNRTHQDLAIVTFSSVLFWILATHYELSEEISAFSTLYERIQLDELPLTLLVLSIGLAWYSWRRSVDAKKEIQARILSQSNVQELLSHNSDLAQRLFTAQEDERRLLARELHDEMGQTCTAIRTEATVLSMSSLNSEEVKKSAMRISDSAKQLSLITRHMLQQLRPMVLDSMGVGEAVLALCQQWQQTSGIVCQAQITELPDNLSDYLCVTVYRLVQEALTNAARHSRASSVWVEIRLMSADSLELSVADNGQGMALLDSPQRGFGLLGMQERVASLKGTFKLQSQPQLGVQIHICLPLEAA